MSDLINYKIKNYEENDVVKELEIYNKIMKNFDPEAHKYTVENMDYRYKSKTFDPEQVKFLVDTKTGEIIGYSAVDLTETEAHIEYPFILDEHRTEELMDYLFKEALSYAKSKRDLIISDPYKQSITSIVEFFKKYDATPHEMYKNYKIDVEKLNYDISPVKAYEVTVDSLEKLNDFIKNAKKPSGGVIEKEYFENQFKEGNFSPERFKYIEKDGTILGAVAASLQRSDNENEPPTSSLNFYLMDLDHPNANDFRRASVGSLYQGLKNEGVKEFTVGIGEESPAKPIFKEIGFKEFDEAFTRYKF